ncbi:MAG: cyclic nucleotide-binding domain-containing protein [Planctomycetota bacterium]|jgi:CRP-like cAMP-binding protein
MTGGGMGREYAAGEAIVTQGDVGDCMFVVQAGEVEVVHEEAGEPVRLAVLGPGDFFGEMAIFERQTRSATVRAVADARVLTVDKRTFLRRIQEDPALAFRVVKAMSGRIRQLNDEIARLSSGA